MEANVNRREIKLIIERADLRIRVDELNKREQALKRELEKREKDVKIEEDRRRKREEEEDEARQRKRARDNLDYYNLIQLNNRTV